MGSLYLKGPAGRLHVEDGGEGGLPVVLVHSLAGEAGQWTAQLAHLRRTRRAVALELRGHGGSEAQAGEGCGPDALAGDIGAVVDGLGLGRFVLVGHSLGGAVCVAYAGAHPERVAGLFLLDPSSDGRDVPPEAARGMLAALEQEGWAATLEAFWAPMLEPSRPEVREAVLASLRRTPRHVISGALAAMLSFDPVTPLQRYGGPRLSVITACNDVPGALHQRVPELPHRRVEGTGHWAQLDRPAEVNALLDGFLAAVP